MATVVLLLAVAVGSILLALAAVGLLTDRLARRSDPGPGHWPPWGPHRQSSAKGGTNDESRK